MNPIDPLELSSFSKRLYEMMPLQTDVTLKIPKVMFGDFPKNASDFKIKRFSKTLDKYQHIIEEMEYRGRNIDDFKNYSKKYFREAIGHDSNSFFKNYITPDLRDTRNIGRQKNNPFILFPHVNGSTFETWTSGTSSTNLVDGTIIYNSIGAVATVGQYYDQLAISLGNSTGTWILCAYSDSSNPVNLISGSKTSTYAADGAYTLKSCTSEWSVPTTTLWLGAMVNNSGCLYNYKNVSQSFQSGLSSLTPPTTASVTSTQNFIARMKVSHS